MKKLVLLLLPLLFLTACGSNASTEKSTGSSSGQDELAVKAEFMTIAEKTIKEIYSLADPKVQMDDLMAAEVGDDANAETGEKYTNVVTGTGKIAVGEKTYSFDMVYNMDDKREKYSVLYLKCDYDKTKGLDTPLESDN